VSTGDLVVWCDADIQGFDTRFVTGLLGPLLSDPSVEFTKGFYERTERDGVGGGRVTELTARPLLELFSRGISVIGKEPSQAHALKLGGNFLISTMIHSLGEAFVYAARQGIDPEVFLDTINCALFQSPLYAAYGKVMLHPPEQPGATIDLGAKDIRLLREAAAARETTLSLADNLAEIFAQAQQYGLADEDWAVGQYKMAKRRSATPIPSPFFLFSPTKIKP
jgi:hypothetical protein